MTPGKPSVPYIPSASVLIKQSNTCIESACAQVSNDVHRERMCVCGYDVHRDHVCVCVYVYVSNDAKRERVRVCVYDVHRECVMARLLARLR